MYCCTIPPVTHKAQWQHADIQDISKGQVQDGQQCLIRRGGARQRRGEDGAGAVEAVHDAQAPGQARQAGRPVRPGHQQQRLACNQQQCLSRQHSHNNATASQQEPRPSSCQRSWHGRQCSMRSRRADLQATRRAAQCWSLVACPPSAAPASCAGPAQRWPAPSSPCTARPSPPACSPDTLSLKPRPHSCCFTAHAHHLLRTPYGPARDITAEK